MHFFDVILLAPVFCCYTVQRGYGAVFVNILRYGTVGGQNIGGTVWAQCNKIVPT